MPPFAPSITFWSRVEPSPRSRSIADGVAARLRDPLWMLTRQWQLGEFRGEDAASPAFAQISTRVSPLETWTAGDADPQPVAANAPFERSALGEDFSQIDAALPADTAQVADLSLAIELGQVFERALLDRDRPDLLPRFRAAYRLADDAPHVDERDREGRQLLQVATGRVTHGGRLHLAADRALPDLPAEPPLTSGDAADVRAALDRLRAWVTDTVGTIGQADARAWNPARLEYSLAVQAHAPSGERVVLHAHPDREGLCEAYAFDVAERHPATAGEAAEPRVLTRSVIPGNVSFRGMPNPRWWTFESGLLNFGAVRPEKREVAKLVVLDFMLVHSNDWFVVPFRQPLGTLCRLDSLVVRDVFGGLTRVERADRPSVTGEPRWTMFSTSIAGTNDVADFFVVAGTPGAGTQSSAAIEEVRFVRDEMANLAWGIERVIANAAGGPWPSQDRARVEAMAATPVAPSAPDAPPLKYRIQTSVPEHWMPFVPVRINATSREIALERGVLLTDAGTAPAAPAGRILRPTNVPDGRYRLREEEVPREGVRVARVIQRARWVDGSTHLWMKRTKTVEAREERSGLLFDVVERTTTP